MSISKVVKFFILALLMWVNVYLFGALFTYGAVSAAKNMGTTVVIAVDGGGN